MVTGVPQEFVRLEVLRRSAEEAVGEQNE
jgi:hypothetical protein